MTGLILMLAMAAVMVLLREPLGRGLAQLAGAVDWKRLAMFAVLLFLAWALLHHVQLMMGPVSGDAIVALFDASTYAALFDASAWADLAIGLAAMVLDRRTRLMLVRLIDLVRGAVHGLCAPAARAAGQRGPDVGFRTGRSPTQAVSAGF